ncbi:MAG: hypothetical protein GY782_04855 [Gammaproteobacteria bacterium]|nr:hypothetical protein [Gammaproteobacteria bacterium]
MNFTKWLYSGLTVGLLALFFSGFGFLDPSKTVDAQHGTSGRLSNVFVTHDYEEVGATSTTVYTITSGLIDTTYPDTTNRAYIIVSGQGIRFTCDGTTPSTSLGNPVPVGTWFQVTGLTDIQNFQFVNDDDTGTATCHINLQYEEEMN